MPEACVHAILDPLFMLFMKQCLLCCSEFQQLKVLQSSLPAVAQSEADACKSLISAFNAWFAANYTSQAGMPAGATQVSLALGGVE